MCVLLFCPRSVLGFLQLAEYKFTTTHFRDENSQLQLRVNQLEDRNKLTEERNSILQKVSL